jgi:hypothetical membrane protein
MGSQEGYMTESRKERILWLSAPASALLFAASLIGFAAARDDGYSHATKAISELGSVDAPLAAAFNVLGFILPGALIFIFSMALLKAGRSSVGPCLLAASGLMLALAGLASADLENLGSPSSILHAVGAIGSGIMWLFALFWLGPVLRRDFGLVAWGAITPWFATFLFANVGWQIAFRETGLVMPGWGQRIGFFGYFAWIAITGLLLWVSASRKQDRVHEA